MTENETSQLRKDVAALANSMCDLRATLNRLESCYSYQAPLTDGTPGRSDTATY